MEKLDPVKAREVNCPNCGKACLFSPANRWRPFCSERCKKIDLGAWASDQYRIAGAGDPPASGDDGALPRH
jgi:endogenous inhibitor of DNA gyrase (YacG/DUF329 family)